MHDWGAELMSTLSRMPQVPVRLAQEASPFCKRCCDIAALTHDWVFVTTRSRTPQTC